MYCHFLFLFDVKFLTRFDVFVDFVIFGLFSFKFYRLFAVKCLSTLILCNFHVKKDNARLLMILLCRYKAFGCTNRFV